MARRAESAEDTEEQVAIEMNQRFVTKLLKLLGLAPRATFKQNEEAIR